jgi:hypothetical protein
MSGRFRDGYIKLLATEADTASHMQPNPVMASAGRLLNASFFCYRRQASKGNVVDLLQRSGPSDPQCCDVFDGCRSAIADPPFKRNTVQRVDDAVQLQEWHSWANPQQRADRHSCLRDLQALDGITDKNSMFLGKHCKLVRLLQFCAFKAAEARSGECHLFEQKRSFVIPNLLTSTNEVRALQFKPFLLLRTGALNRCAKKLDRESYRFVIFGSQIIECERTVTVWSRTNVPRPCRCVIRRSFSSASRPLRNVPRLTPS